MATEPDPQLEKQIDCELRASPEFLAPETLVPRVLAAIQARAAVHWWQRPWRSWPRAARLVSFWFLFLTLGLLAFGSFQLWDLVSLDSLTDRFVHRLSATSALWETAATLANAVGLLLRAVEPWLIYGFGVLFLIYAACIGIGTACFRLAANKKQ